MHSENIWVVKSLASDGVNIVIPKAQISLHICTQMSQRAQFVHGC